MHSSTVFVPLLCCNIATEWMSVRIKKPKRCVEMRKIVLEGRYGCFQSFSEGFQSR